MQNAHLGNVALNFNIMRNFKKLFFLFFFSSITVIASNSNSDKVFCDSFEEMVSLNLPFYASDYETESLIEEVNFYYFTKDNNRYSVKILVSFDNRYENLVNISMSSNYFNITEVSQVEVEEGIVSNFNGDGEENQNDGMSPHASCIEACKDKYTDDDGNKIRGRGACKANCWVDTTIRTLDAISPF